MSGPADRDRDARRAAQTVFDRPLVVEAGAGTGKTTTLVARVLAWTLGAGWQRARERGGEEAGPEQIAARVLEGVVAITFTEAAAAEMASRVARGLAGIASGRADDLPGFEPELLATGPGDALAPRAAALLGALDRLSVRTIHAYCRSLLAHHPLEVGLNPELKIDADGRLIEEIARRVLESRIKEAYARGASPLLELAEQGVGPDRVLAAVLQWALEGVPAAVFEADPFAPARLAEACRELAARLEGLLEATGGRRGMARIRKAVEVLTAVETTRAGLEELPDEGLAGAAALGELVRAHWERTRLARLGSWAKGRFGQTEKAVLGERRGDVSAAARALRERLRHLEKLDPAALDRGRRAIGPLLREVQTEARAAGVAGFASLLLDAGRLLAENPSVRRTERRRIDQLLVDEFQDTDALQCDLIRLLALSGRAADRPGLFIVGDPKQSIYGWRNADLAAYEELVAAALAAGGERFSLRRNFRSAPVLLQEVERTVAPVMRAEAGIQPPFEGLEPSAATASWQGFRRDGWAPLECWVSWDPERLERGGKAASVRAAEIEAAAVAADVEAVHRVAGVPWKEMAILFRSMGSVDFFLEALRAADVPFTVTSDKQYFRRREVIDAAALVRAVINPVDHLALLTLLRSPAVGVPDAALVPLWRHALPRLLSGLDGDGDGARLAEIETAIAAAAAATPDGIPGIERIAGWPESLKAAVHLLARARRNFASLPADRFVERLRSDWLFEAGEAARFLGRYRLANLERLFRRLEEGLAAPGADVASVVRSLRRSVGEEQEAAEALPKDAAEDAVQVMTLHKAKGLEFRHVYMVQLHAGVRPPNDSLQIDTRWRTRDSPEYVLFGSPTLGFDAVRRHQDRVAAAELVRLLYVGMTRAAERLVLVGTWPDVPTPPRPGKVPTMMELLGERRDLPASIRQLLPPAAAQPPWSDAGGARWKFPAFHAGPDDGLRQAPRAALDVVALEDGARRLARLDETAALHMRRPLLGRAAAEELEAAAVPAAAGALPEPAAARHVGEAIHRLLEGWDFADDLERQAERQRRQLERLVGARSRPGADAGRERAAELFERLVRGRLLASLVRRPGDVVARELAVFAPAEPGADEPVGGVAGKVDLVLSGPAPGDLTIVDYKTDAVEPGPELEERASRYARQLGFYRRALTEALGLERPPRAELWFLWADERWVLPGEAAIR